MATIAPQEAETEAHASGYRRPTAAAPARAPMLTAESLNAVNDFFCELLRRRFSGLDFLPVTSDAEIVGKRRRVQS